MREGKDCPVASGTAVCRLRRKHGIAACCVFVVFVGNDHGGCDGTGYGNTGVSGQDCCKHGGQCERSRKRHGDFRPANHVIETIVE